MYCNFKLSKEEAVETEALKVAVAIMVAGIVLVCYLFRWEIKFWWSFGVSPDETREKAADAVSLMVGSAAVAVRKADKARRKAGRRLEIKLEEMSGLADIPQLVVSERDELARREIKFQDLLQRFNKLVTLAERHYFRPEVLEVKKKLRQEVRTA